MKKILVSLFIMLIVAPMLMFASGALEEQTDEGTIVIGMQQVSYAPYCIAIVEGAQARFDEEGGIEMNVKYGDGTSEGQVSDLEDFVAMGVDGIIFFPWISSATRTALLECADAGIPVVVVDNPVEDTDLVVSQVATDNYLAGVENANHVIEDLGGEGNIIILDTPENNSSLLRANGFVDTVSEYPGITILEQQNYNADQQTAMNIMEDLLQVYDDVDAVFVCNEDGAFGVYAALEAAGRTDIGIYTVDGSANGVAMVLEGHITGIAAQQPYLMGYEAADQMIRYFNGEETTLDFALGIEYITSENASTWEGY